MKEVIIEIYPSIEMQSEFSMFITFPNYSESVKILKGLKPKFYEKTFKKWEIPFLCESSYKEVKQRINDAGYKVILAQKEKK